MGSTFISAIHKSSGKTIISIGLTAAFADKGLSVQTFKKGPDYIDPMWLSRASNRKCRNLDFHFMTNQEIRSEFTQFGLAQDLSIIEGNKGLHDGLDLKGTDCNASLAKLIKSPVILVLDTRGITRGVAPMIQGQINFDKDVNIVGVILNFVGGQRHEKKLTRAIEYYTDTPVLGSIPKTNELIISERHLGLIPSNETKTANQIIKKIKKVVEKNVDLEKVLKIANAAHSLVPSKITKPKATRLKNPVRIAVALDDVFGFYYPNDFLALEIAGAELKFFNTITDSELPPVDGLFIGGGFPETNVHRLTQNTTLRQHILYLLNDGLPAYAECGGLMYLSKSITWKGNTSEMVGFVPGESVMNEKPVGRGYAKLRETPDCPWPEKPGRSQEIPTHEFHYATIKNLPSNTVFAYDVLRGYGVNGEKDGIVLKNLLAGFTHHFSTPRHNWANRFVEFIRDQKV